MTKAIYALVGMKHRGTEDLVASLRDGAEMRIVRDALNEHDRNAVQVWHGDVCVGFVKREQAAGLAKLMDKEPKIESARAVLRATADRWPMIEVIE